LAYFVPVIEEVLQLKISPHYFRYLRFRLAQHFSGVSHTPTCR